MTVWLRPAVVGPVLAVTLLALACGPADRGTDDGRQPNAPAPSSEADAALCDLLEVPMKYARDDALSFVTLLDDDRRESWGIRAMVAFLVPGEPEAAGRYRPVLAYLASLGRQEPGPGAVLHGPPPPAVRRNAASLDAFLAAGGCS